MEERSLEVEPGQPVSVSIHGVGETALVLGHGAGGTRRTPLLVRLADALSATGRRVLLFAFPYSEARRRLPDKAPLLEATVAAVVRLARDELGAKRVVAGGKSMGGRMASQAAANGPHVDGLVFLGYPLHPPGRFDKLRDAHLPKVTAPMLFIQGTRDDFARWDLLEATLAKLGDGATLLKIDDGDHSFTVRKKLTGKSAADVERLIAESVVAWLAAHGL
jgi:predicted alpha/beta-hydrolase family hydrolase